MYCLIGWLAAAGSFIGVYAVGRKARAGFLICVAAEIGWFVKGIGTGQYDLATLGVVFACLHLQNYRRWAPV